jgi:hypothetical protein
MPLDNQNHLLAFRPLKGGIAVQNPVVQQIGTIGLIGTSDGNDRWIVSCYHVLCRMNAAYPIGMQEPIFQPYQDDDQLPVAMVDVTRSNEDLDCAAAQIVATASLSEIFGVGHLRPPEEPVVGMRVLKSGADTGITEGRITSLVNDVVQVDATGMSPEYRLNGPGDSGAVWVNAANNAPVALHQRGDPFNIGTRGFAMPIRKILAALGLEGCVDN